MNSQITSPESSVREIKLADGKIATVSSEDFQHLSQFRWYARKHKTGTYYAERQILNSEGKRQWVSMAREVLGLTDFRVNGTIADHSDHNTLNNTRDNLRACTAAENTRNARMKSHNRSGYKGVSRTPVSKSRPWRSQIWKDGTNEFLGLFANPIDAAKRYDQAAREAFGDFAYLNFPLSSQSELLAA